MGYYSLGFWCYLSVFSLVIWGFQILLAYEIFSYYFSSRPHI
jgi:hypothetical protein